MSNLAMIDFQIFPSHYEQNGDGEKCCWMGGRESAGNPVTLQPYQTDAISGHSNPGWGFHLLSVGGPLIGLYRLKYVKMSAPDKYWYGVTVENGKLVLTKYKEGIHFSVKKLGEYYTLRYDKKYVECANGNLGQNTDIQVWDITPPTQDQVSDYNTIPSESFRILWKFVKMDHMSGREWITKLSATNRSTLTIDRLFIPGGHDSGTEKNTQWYQTQFHTIPEQVAMGIRYFDLRVAENWDIYHNTSSSGISLKYVVDAVLAHFANHPDEFFFLQITPEKPNLFSSRLYDYLIANCATVFNHVYMPSSIPTVAGAKGKIFFFARLYTLEPHTDPNYPFKEHEIDWLDDTVGSNASLNPFVTPPNVYVQDHYSNVGNSDKFDNYVKPTLYNKMFPGTDADWIINYTSVSNSGYPIHDAEEINPWVANLLMWTSPFPSGVLMIDDARVGNVANIIALNFD